jgi:hypothetical protein
MEGRKVVSVRAGYHGLGKGRISWMLVILALICIYFSILRDIFIRQKYKMNKYLKWRVW